MNHLNTYFYNEKHELIGSLIGLVPIAVGTMVVFNDGSYLVQEVQLHSNSGDSYSPEEMGFRVFCKANV